ncbi:MAG: glycerate kinase [Lactobacillaceae bacterium]|jgi:glycerate kinase|nr:glycerate kinase [Lactobacillaceae bacterium]
MKIVIAPDSFKGSLTSKDATQAIYKGFNKIMPDASYTLMPMADGGDGTVDVLVATRNGTLHSMQVKGPYLEPVEAKYGLSIDGDSAAIEVAETSGLQYINPSTVDPLATNTFGFGELIIKLLDQGIKRIYMGLGGSATNDGGIGMAAALGVKFYDVRHHELEPIPYNLRDIEFVDITGIDLRIAQTEMIVISDVENPLLGDNGATFVYGRQKGLTTENQLVRADYAMEKYAQAVAKVCDHHNPDEPGAGAAGGLGFALLAFTNATRQSGAEFLMRVSGFTQAVSDADVVVVGEGSLDNLTHFGKSPFAVATQAKRVNPQAMVVGLAAHIGDVEALYEAGVDAVFSILPGVQTLEVAIDKASYNLEATAESVARLIKATHKAD